MLTDFCPTYELNVVYWKEFLFFKRFYIFLSESMLTRAGWGAEGKGRTDSPLSGEPLSWSPYFWPCSLPISPPPCH